MFSFNRRRSQIPTDSFETSSVDSNRPQSYPPYHSKSRGISTVRILLVGQIYEETILYVDEYPKEDQNIKAHNKIKRQGGGVCNTAQVLSQFPRLDPCLMSCLGNKMDSSGLVSSLEDKGIKTRSCTFRKTPTPSTFIIQNTQYGTRTVISCNGTIELTKDEFIQNFNMTGLNKTIAPYSWIHFECKLAHNVLEQINWLEAKANLEGWRSQLTISLDFENPHLPEIDVLLPKADVIFFSKSFAVAKNFYHPKDFLKSIYPQCKVGSLLFCAWGEQGVTCLLDADDLIHASGIPVHDVIDPFGAKDTFIAGIIFCLCQKFSALTALKFSCEMANRKTSKVGFDGLAEMMWKLWDASLDLAQYSSADSVSSASTLSSPLITAFKAMEMGLATSDIPSL